MKISKHVTKKIKWIIILVCVLIPYTNIYGQQADTLRIKSIYTVKDTVIKVPLIFKGNNFNMAGLQLSIPYNHNYLSTMSSKLGTHTAFESVLLSNDILTFNVKNDTIKIAWNGSQSVNDGDTLGVFYFYVKPETPTFSPLGVTFDNNASQLILDENGNPKSVTLENGMIIPEARLSGKAVFWDSTSVGIDSALISVSGSDTASTFRTDSNGLYQGVLMQDSMKISAYRPLLLRDRMAISVADIVELQRVIVGLQPHFTGLREEVADVNNDSSISVVDGYYMDKFVLGNINEMPAGSWKIIPSQNIDNSFSTIDTTLTLKASDDTSGVNFTGILFGDINGSWANQTSSNKEILKRNMLTFGDHIPVGDNNQNQIIRLPVADQTDTVNISLFGSFDQSIAGWQLPVKYPKDNIHLVGIKSQYGEVKFSNHPGYYGNGEVSMILWHNVVDPITVGSGSNKIADLTYVLDQGTNEIQFVLGSERQWVNVQAETLPGEIWVEQDTVITGIEHYRKDLPRKTELMEAYPNPFNPTTTIRYKLAKTSNVKLTIFNSVGREVENLVNKKQQAGLYQVHFNGQRFTSGIYLYRLITDGYKKTKKIILLK